MSRGKARKSEPRRERKRTRPTLSEAPPPPLTVSIVTYPTTNDAGQITVMSDVDLVKSAVLYADKVELISLGATMLGSVETLNQGGLDAMVELMTSLDDETLALINGGKPLPDNWRFLIGPLMAILESPEAAQQLGIADMTEELKRLEESTKSQLAQLSEQMITASGMEELLPCVDSGLLTFTGVGLGTESAVKSAVGKRLAAAELASAVSSWIDLLAQRLNDDRTRLLFDAQAGDLVQAMLSDGVIESNSLGLKHAGQAALGAGLVARLPAFPAAPMDELLDLRTDLSDALTRYRRAAFRLAADLPGEVGSSLESRIDDLWLAEVAPAILEIEERLADHGLVREIARSAATNVRTLFLEGAGIYVGMSTLGGLSDLISATAAVGGSATQAAVSGSLASVEGRRDVKRQDLFYLYEANRRLRP